MSEYDNGGDLTIYEFTCYGEPTPGYERPVIFCDKDGNRIGHGYMANTPC